MLLKCILRALIFLQFVSSFIFVHVFHAVVKNPFCPKYKKKKKRENQLTRRKIYLNKGTKRETEKNVHRFFPSGQKNHNFCDF